MKTIKGILSLLISIIVVVGLFLGLFILIGFAQEKLFLPEDYLMWIFKFPFSRLVFIYELYIILGLFYIFNKDLKWLVKKILNNTHKKKFTLAFIALNIVLLYIILFNVTVITKDKIIDYNFLSPKGKEYTHEDVVKINTGVYGKKFYLPFTHSKGDFYYIIELTDGTKIGISELSGIKNEEDDHRFIIEKLDINYVNMGAEKISSIENFQYTTEHLDKIYTDKIKSILENTKP